MLKEALNELIDPNHSFFGNILQYAAGLMAV